MKKKKREIVILIVLILIAIVLVIIGITAYVKSDLKELQQLPISDVELTEVEDGVYIGSYKWSPVYAVVEVTINNHEITQIDLIEHEYGRGAPAEIITQKVVEAQTLDVDIVSGATYSSKVILKAIENALE
ncbi:FMN-binding protein [Alkalibaculum sporogenes]|nr:FMN-binding protein [Alkalibaculum sporogenes]